MCCRGSLERALRCPARAAKEAEEPAARVAVAAASEFAGRAKKNWKQIAAGFATEFRKSRKILKAFANNPRCGARRAIPCRWARPRLTATPTPANPRCLTP